MLIALVISVVLSFLTAILGGLTLLAFLRLRSTMDRDRTAVHEGMQRLSARVGAVVRALNDHANQLTAIGTEPAPAARDPHPKD